MFTNYKKSFHSHLTLGLSIRKNWECICATEVLGVSPLIQFNWIRFPAKLRAYWVVLTLKILQHCWLKLSSLRKKSVVRTSFNVTLFINLSLVAVGKTWGRYYHPINLRMFFNQSISITCQVWPSEFFPTWRFLGLQTWPTFEAGKLKKQKNLPTFPQISCHQAS